MVAVGAPDDEPAEAGVQTFETDREPADALNAAAAYLEGAGAVSASMKGRLVRTGDEIVIHYGRLTTNVTVSPTASGSTVRVARRGTPPMESTRPWIIIIGLAAFVLGWGLAWYNADDGGLTPLATITLFFLGIFAAVILLFVVDRSLEKRGASVCRSLEDAMKRDPVLILRREVDGLERSSAIANAVLFYCASILFEFLVFVILWSEGVRDGIDQAVTLDVMKAGFGLPVVPSVLFGVIWYFAADRLHNRRLTSVEPRLDGFAAGDAKGQ